MFFSRIAGTVSRSARSRLQSNRFSGFRHGRIPAVTESCLEAKPCVYGGLACLRSNGGIGIGAGNQFVRTRLFCTKSPEKRSDSNTDPSNLELLLYAVFVGLVIPLLCAHADKYALLHDQEQISFEEFCNLLDEPGLVDHIEVMNGSIAKVWVSNLENENVSEHYEKSIKGDIRLCKHNFKVESGIEELEEKLEEAQSCLGIEPRDYVPVVYSRKGGYMYRFVFGN